MFTLFPGSFNPTTLSNLALWLDAADTSPTNITESSGKVSIWSDKSGLGNDATQGTGAQQPTTNATTINGRNVIDFDEVSSNNLNLGQPASLDFTPQTDEFTVFTVVNVDTNNEGATFSKAGASLGLRQFHHFIQTNAFKSVIGGTQRDFSGTATGSPKILSQTTTTSEIEGFVNGVSGGGGSIGTATNSNDILIGARRADDANGGLAFLLTGSIAEIIVYGRSVTDLERVQVETYLADKWGI